MTTQTHTTGRRSAHGKFSTINRWLRMTVCMSIVSSIMGCPPDPPVPPTPPITIDEANQSNTNEPESTTNETQENKSLQSLHQLTDKIDLTEAIADTERVFAKHGLPKDWYKTLTNDSSEENSVLIAAIWTMIEPDVASQFQNRFGTKRKPSGRISSQEIHGDNDVFEELLYRVFKGEDHGTHISFNRNMSVDVSPLPNVHPDFLGRDGSVDFAKVRDAFVAALEEGDVPVAVNATASKADNDDEWCRIVCEWRTPEGLPEWGTSQLAWRPTVRVEFVDGNQETAGGVSGGNRRLMLSCYAEIGYRKESKDNFQAIHLAGPYHVTSYQPVGMANGFYKRSGMNPTTRICQHGNLTYANLESLNAEMTDLEQEQADILASRQVSAAETPNPVWAYGAGTNAVLEDIHNRLNPLLKKPQ